MPRKVFVAGEILTAADVNTNLMDQAVMVFDDSTARGSAIPSPSEGMVTYLKDTDALEKYTTTWEPVDTTGKILQVASAVRTTNFTTSSTSFVDWTDVSVSITPTATSSKILVLLNAAQFFINQSAGQYCAFQIVRDATALYDQVGVQENASSYRQSATAIFLDSPNTTSATTYKAQVKVVVGGTGTFSLGSITVMEVAG